MSDDPTDGDLRALPGAAEPPPELEGRVLAALRARGLLGPRPRPWRWWLAAASLICFALGWSARGLTGRGPAPASDGSLYVLLLSRLPGPPDGAAEARRVEEYRSCAGALRRQNRLGRAEKLGDESTVLGRAAGPDTDTSGIFLIRAGSMEEAVALARNCPHLRHGGRIT